MFFRSMDSYRHLSVSLLVLLALLGAVSHAEGFVSFNSLSSKRTLVVTVSMANNSDIKEVHTGQDSILVNWSVNASAPAIVDAKTVETRLCFAKESQTLRGWRKTDDNLKKDKTCLYKIQRQPYAPAGSVTYALPKSIPGAKYFVRAYVFNSSDLQIAYGQSSPNKINNTFTVIPISGRHGSIDAAVGVFSIFSVGSLFAFFIFENLYLKRKKAV